ncbi:MAPK regulated corepressor interacting protein 2 [Cyrtonyx montezumae]|uniref:MAPK regulated corepressor interacting protein 2 n=1 Tax=Cyrtonyx montezumae TaxID=9017 RepID=UPI0032DAEA8F
MYTLTRGPSKLATQRRTGPTQQPVESKVGEPRGRLQPGAWPPASPAQKLIFNRVNGKRPQVLLPHTSVPEESYTAAHEENVRFVYEAWQEVEQQLDGGQRGESTCGPVQYVEKTPNPRLKNFVPIDLEEWWAQQFLAKIESCS